MMDAEQPNERLLGKSGLLCCYYYDYTNGSQRKRICKMYFDIFLKNVKPLFIFVENRFPIPYFSSTFSYILCKNV